jgi:hypothetical protein
MRGDGRPYVPQGEWLRDVGVLDRAAVRGDAGPDVADGSLERQADQAGMAEQAGDGRPERAEQEPVARTERRRCRPVFGRRAPVAGAERERDEPAHVVGPERRAAGQTDLDWQAGRLMGACEAGRNGGGVVRNQQVAGTEELGEVVAWEALDGAGGVDDQQSAAGAVCRDRHGPSHPSHPERSKGAIPSVTPPSLRSG